MCHDGYLRFYKKLVRFNYQVDDAIIPFLNQKFFNLLAFRQIKDMTLDV